VHHIASFMFGTLLFFVSNRAVAICSCLFLGKGHGHQPRVRPLPH